MVTLITYFWISLDEQLLIPHVRHTLQINTMARKSVLGPDGILHTVWIINMYISKQSDLYTKIALLCKPHLPSAFLYLVWFCGSRINLILIIFVLCIIRVHSDGTGWWSSWEGLSLNWPTTLSVCQRTSLHEDWSPSPTSSTEMTAWSCGMSLAGEVAAECCSPSTNVIKRV